MSRGPSGSTLFVGAALLGLAGGWLLAQRHDRIHSEDLFADAAWKRFAALGWMEREADPASLPLLQDYLAWERTPTLQLRARRLVSVLEAAIA
ncbi:MAG: hypothetical protein IPP98_14225 [Gemmatimonadetes bacterium]|nr:hypothetical protein [Gemmatimonadota bacterium]